MGGEQSKLGVALTKDARRKMKRSKNRAQANTPTHADTGVAGSVSLSDASLCGTAVKKKQKTGKKRKRNTCSSADTTRKSRASDAAAGTDVVERTGEAKQLPLVLLPLGTFTFWQVLLLAAAAHWLGTGATVLRRTAAGPPEVVWRSSKHENPAGKATEALP